jgi:hypothetical protein
VIENKDNCHYEPEKNPVKQLFLQNSENSDLKRILLFYRILTLQNDSDVK